jgi:hypothetical protein
MVAGTASAGTNITITNESSDSMEYGVVSNLSALPNGTDNILLVLNTTNTTSITWNINVTNTTQDVTIYNGTTDSLNNLSINMSEGGNITINLTSTACIPFFTINVSNAANGSEYAVSTNLSFVPAASTGVVQLNESAYQSGETANVSVTDSDMNKNSSIEETLIVNITSTTNTTNTSLTLTETGADTGIFSSTVFDFSAVGDGDTIRVSDSDTIYANYTDNNSVLRSDSADFDAIASKLNINSTTYGNLTTRTGAETTPSSMVAGVATVFKINATDANNVLDTGFTGTMTISVNGSATATPVSYTFVTADNGTKNISVTDNVAESIMINFNSTSFTNATTTETVVPNKPTKLAFNSSMPLSTLTNSLRVKISLTDAYNNPFNVSRLGTGSSGNVSTATHLGGTDGLGTGVSLNVTLALYPKLNSALDTTSIVINQTSVITYLAYVNDSTDETITLHATSDFFAAIQTDLSFLPAVSYMVIDTNKTDDTAHANGGVNWLGVINITAQLMSASDVPLAVPGTVVTFTTSNSTVLNSVGTATTNANGIATLAAISTTTTAGTALVGATAPGGIVGLNATGGSIGLTVTTTPVVSKDLSTLSVAATARAGENVTVYATIKDYSGTTVPAGTTVSFNITSGDSVSTLNGVVKGTIVTADTNSMGVATVTFRGTNGTMPGVDSNINATIVDEAGDTQRVGAAEQTIKVIPNDAAVLVVSPASKGLASLLGESVIFNVTTYDSYGNINTSVGTVKINVSTTNPALGNMTVGATTVNNYAVITAASGTGQMNYTVNSTTPGNATLTFGAYTYESGQATGLINNITTTALVTTSGATSVTITPSVTGTSVGNNVILTMNLTDNAGNLIAIDGVNMSLISSAGPTSLNTTTLTSANGQAFANLSVATPQTVTVTVYVEGLTSASTSVVFSGNATSIVITPESTSINVDETTNLTIQAYDAFGNKAAIYNGVVITSETGIIPAVTGLTFSDTSFTFNATGCAVVNVTSAISGTYTIQVIALDLISTVDLEFTDVGLLNMTVTATPSSVIVNTSTSVVFNVTSDGTPINGAIVTLSGAGVSLNGTTTNGTVTIEVNATSSGTIDVTATKAGYEDATTSVTVTGTGAPALVSALTPNSRTAQVGTPVTVFMSVINYGTAAATGVSITQESSLPATVSYQTWDGTALTGTADTPVDMAAGETVNFVLIINATSAFSSSAMTFNVSGTNVAPAPISGVNTLTMSANATLPPDVIMISTSLSVSTAVDTPTAFAVATYNVGADATGVSFLVDVPSGISGLVYQVNETNLDGSIKGPATGLTIATGEMPTFAVFLTPTAAIANDPANNRITIKLVDGSSNVIGAQSIAVYTT